MDLLDADHGLGRSDDQASGRGELAARQMLELGIGNGGSPLDSNNLYASDRTEQVKYIT